MKYRLMLITLLFLAGCRKEKGADEIRYIPQELKDYMYFKKGTWWVYEEETTHERDSVIVFYNDDSLITFDGSTGTAAGTYEYFDCNSYSFYDDYGYYYTCNTTWTYHQRTPVFRDKTKPGDFVGETIIMFNNFILNAQMQPYTQYGYVRLTGIFDSLVVNGKTFFQVKRYFDSKNSIEGNDSTNFYVSPHLGIIKKEIYSTNKIWLLTNYKIIQ